MGEAFSKRLREYEAMSMARFAKQAQQDQAWIAMLTRNLWNTPAGATAPNLVPLPALPKALVAGPIVGWRLWAVDRDGILYGVGHRKAWPMGEPMRAACVSEGWVRHPAPVAGCQCGVYGVKQREMVPVWTYHANEGEQIVLGQVALWGRVIEHRDGYRAEWGYPARIVVTRARPMPGFPSSRRMAAWWEKIGENYGIAVETE